MKKLSIFLFSFGILLLTLSACGNVKNNKNEYSDKAFMSDLALGLENRWSDGDKLDKIKDPSTSQTKEYYNKFVNDELNAISSYKDKKFKDSKLQALAIQYINALKDSKKAINSLDTMDGMKKWSDAYNTRTKLLVELKNDYNLKVNSKYNSYLEDLEKDGQEAVKNDEVKEKITALVNGIVFKYKPEEYDDTYKKYEATVENTTGSDISNFNGQVNLVDSTGVTVGDAYVSAQNWKAGSKVLFEFTTDKTFDKTVITSDYTLADQ
ncbi:FxLYD domain-containing protein [Lactococcus lactis]|uniref:FxLYD domain-containing protein n=1 Tax=Lactococcus lactis TaxID=1358 RepID=UPI00319E0C2F